MEIGTEISHKIRSAIKAKLVDLGAYVDDELPDYIMVMVANKKTKEQMADDLSLFLGNNTEKFTSWLHSLLTKLKAITSGNSADTRMEDLIKDEQPKADPVIVHEDAIQDRAKSQTGVSQTKKTTEINDALKEKGKQKKEKSVTSNKSAAPKDQKLEEPATDIVEVTIKDDEFREEEPKDSLHKSTQDKKQTKVSSKVLPTVQKAAPVRSVTSVAPAKVSAKAGASSRYTPKTSKVRPVVHAQRRSVVGTVVHHSEEEEDEEEYDPHNPAVGSVASVIRVTERK
ncbi:zinc finger CCCH domain-containing protein 14-like [Lingula anatina]|uniref:Zinc finger CCCH domain-containing protein 14 n=1 Tax=Lingula anatina TaxID=7574 RepID=A0A2R2MN49_LINAN|nr:zinc finger CCCH domain-containing protein 14-like [Lingula anatina]|eukprot:XP_023931624.1 zinc finger CCCH domain-containing protein 14-like [Lingula anatina]